MVCSSDQLVTLVSSVGQEAADVICNQLTQAAPEGMLHGGVHRALSQAPTDLAGSVDVFFMLFCAYLVFIMQAGFAMLCAGAVRSKNTVNILLKVCARPFCSKSLSVSPAFQRALR